MFTCNVSKKFSIIISLVVLIAVGTALRIKAQAGNSVARNSIEARLPKCICVTSDRDDFMTSETAGCRSIRVLLFAFCECR